MMIELQSTGSYETRHGVMWTVANPLPTGPTDTMRRKLTGAMIMLDGKRVIIDGVEMYMPMTYQQGAPIAIRVRDADACFHPTDALVEHTTSAKPLGDVAAVEAEIAALPENVSPLTLAYANFRWQAAHVLAVTNYDLSPQAQAEMMLFQFHTLRNALDRIATAKP